MEIKEGEEEKEMEENNVRETVNEASNDILMHFILFFSPSCSRLFIFSLQHPPFFPRRSFFFPLLIIVVIASLSYLVL